MGRIVAKCEVWAQRPRRRSSFGFRSQVSYGHCDEHHDPGTRLVAWAGQWCYASFRPIQAAATQGGTQVFLVARYEIVSRLSFESPPGRLLPLQTEPAKASLHQVLPWRGMNDTVPRDERCRLNRATRLSRSPSRRRPLPAIFNEIASDQPPVSSEAVQAALPVQDVDSGRMPACAWHDLGPNRSDHGNGAG